MSGPGAVARAAAIAAILVSACNGQFDFDAWVDAGVPPPIIIVEAGPEETSTGADVLVDPPGTGVHIACGEEECSTSGCCGKTSGFNCVDTFEGGTCAGLLIQCDDTDDCPDGQVCCAEGEDLDHPPCTPGDECDSNPRLFRVHCEPQARCKSDFVTLCDPDRPSPCTQCVASSLVGLPPGYHQCAPAP